jgi:hypothetical protein
LAKPANCVFVAQHEPQGLPANHSSWKMHRPQG